MNKKSSLQFIQDYLHILQCAKETHDNDRCMCSAHPDLKNKLKAEFQKLQDQLGNTALSNKLKLKEPKGFGLNDNIFLPGDEFPLGTSIADARVISGNRTQLKGNVRVLVVLVDFSDKQMTKGKQHFEDLFFSEGKVETGSIREYYQEVSNNLVHLEGEIIGPYRMPLTMRAYANNGAGLDNPAPNARTMCFEAAVAASPDIDFSKYDNDGNGFVDAFVVVHAGAAAEETGDNYDLWSHKWTFTKSLKTDNTKVHSYLTVSEDSTIGVCAHELGHLLFGFPDLYDGDFNSEGIGKWCLMASGNWNNDGKSPCHPSAYCKLKQNWVKIENLVTNREGTVIDDVKESHTVYRLWKDGTKSKEYFLLEHRMKEKYDKFLPGEGLLIYHVDEEIDGNDDQKHYQVALKQCDGFKDLEKGNNQGDESDPWPIKDSKTSFNSNSKPHSKSYGLIETNVAVNNIKLINGKIKADLQVRKETAIPANT